MNVVVWVIGMFLAPVFIAVGVVAAVLRWVMGDE
jgi:hypothetical protein